ncbi:hypothetical protein ASD85_01825 [Rhizobium sp. Root651]|nr:hypothetical protein ASD85_01825 [Rhizobium sp. Root651]
MLTSWFSGPECFNLGAKRESGAPTIGKAGAAPATVSGEPLSIHVTGVKTPGKTGKGDDP